MSESHPIFSRYPELKEFIRILQQEVQAMQRPAHEIILDDQAVMRMLSISKRTLQYYKANKLITTYRFDKSSPRTYYLLSDILEVLKGNSIEAISTNQKIK